MNIAPFSVLQHKALLLFQENTVHSIMENVSAVVLLIPTVLSSVFTYPDAAREIQAKPFHVPETDDCIKEVKMVLCTAAYCIS